MTKRITAAIIDVFLSMIPLFVVCTITLGKIAGSDVNSQIIPIVAFQLIFSPLSVIHHIMEYPYALGISMSQLCLALLIMFVVETIAYSVLDLSPIKKSIGKLIMGLQYEHNLTLGSALLRNAVKTITRYLLGIPLIFAFFSKKRHTLHDAIIRNSVVISR